MKGSRTPIFLFGQHRDTPIYVLDETTFTATHTFEDGLARFTLDRCRALGRRKILFSSGGNLGLALAAYAARQGLTAYSFHPLDNMSWLDAEVFSRPGIRLVAVASAQKTREMMLRLRGRVRGPLGYDPLVPELQWRYEAFGLRARVICDYMRSHRIAFAAVAQTVSAGFGLLAIYRRLRALKVPLPGFLGVQQAGNAAMYRRWSGDKAKTSEPLLIPTLFDRDPDKTFGTYPELARMLRQSHGALTAIDRREFRRYIAPAVLRALARRGLKVTLKNGEPVARSGLTALAGAMKALDRGLLPPGPVLVCMTDGVRPPWRPAVPAAVVRDGRDLDRLAERFLAEP